MNFRLGMVVALVAAAGLGCSSSNVGGTVSGLVGSGLVLQNNGSDDLSIDGDGEFIFATQIASGRPYDVTVLTQPTSPSQTCVVGNGAGSVSREPITNVTVTCGPPTFRVGGTVSGVTAAGLVLQNNLGDDLAVPADGTFTFAAPLATGAGYSVTVLTAPPNQACTVLSATGTINDAAVTNVQVQCSATFSVAIVASDWLPSEAATFIESKPEVSGVTVISDCSLASLQQYDVVLIHGNPNCPEEYAFIDEYVQNGGRVIMTPWVMGNGYNSLASLPIDGPGTDDSEVPTLDITVTDATDPLLQGVTFNTTDAVGYEGLASVPRTGAVACAHWNDTHSSIAVARMSYGSGRSVYLNFHYLTNDSCPVLGGDPSCPDAPYPWAEQLLYNALLWVAGS